MKKVETVEKIARAAGVNPRTIYKIISEWQRCGLIDNVIESEILEQIARLNKSEPKSQSLVPCQAKIKTKKKLALKMVLA